MSSDFVKIYFKKLNPDNEDLTVEKLRELSNQPDLPEEEAKELILNIKRLVNIIIQHQIKKDRSNNDNNSSTHAA
jgi:hypothetical protein